VLSSQAIETLLSTALDNASIQAAVAKALDSEGAVQILNLLFESGLLDQAVDRMIAGDGVVWRLLDKAVVDEQTALLVTQLFKTPLPSHLVARLFETELPDELVDRLIGEGGVVWGAVDKVLASDQAPRVIDRLFETPLPGQVVDRIFQTPLPDQLVDRLIADNGPLWRAIETAMRSAHAGQLAGQLFSTQLPEQVVAQLFRSRLPDQVIDSLVESGLLDQVLDRAVADGAIGHVIDKVLASEDAAKAVDQFFESGLFGRFVDGLLDSRGLWRLVDEIADSPAVTAAITQQGLGFVDQFGTEVRTRSRGADDWLSGAARRLARRRKELPAAGAEATATGEEDDEHSGRTRA
jgi:hypothetical protein